jgi:integrase
MSLRKRGKFWWVDFVTASGERVRQSTGTGNKAEAQELHDKLKSESWRLHKLGDRPKRTWNDAALRWMKEQSHKATAEGDKAKLRWLDRFLRDRDLESITRALIDRITEAKLAEGSSNATVNRYLALVRAILRKCARDWEWLDKAPAVRMLKESSRRIRSLTREQAKALIAELPEHLADMVTFTLATGLRSANAARLTWDQVDMERKFAWVYPDQAKARKAIPVPLNDVAFAVVQRQEGKHGSRVFTYNGKPIDRGSTSAWYWAVKRVGLEKFRFHDLRHVWASWHVQSGTPLFALQELAGWETERMVRRYAHLTGDHLAPYAQRMGESHVANLAHAENDANRTEQ